MSTTYVYLFFFIVYWPVFTVKSQCQCEGWGCFFLTRSEIFGIVFTRAQRRSSSATSLLLYLDLIINKLENPVWQRYVVGNGRRRRNTVSDKANIWLQTFDLEFHNWHWRKIISRYIAVNEFNGLVLCCLRNIFNFDFEWTSGMHKWGCQVELESTMKFRPKPCTSVPLQKLSL